MKKFAIILALAAMMGSVIAGEKEDAMQMVNDAATAVSKDKAAAITEIGNPKGRFVKGEIYVFAYDPVSYTHLDVYKRQG